MSIYPDKKGNRLTGRWCVEVQKGAKRLRGRYSSIAEAEAQQALFIRALTGDAKAAEAVEPRRKFSALSGKPQTLLEAIRKAEGRLWSGKDSAKINFIRLRLIAEVLGGSRSIDAIDAEDIDDLIETLQAQRKLADATVNRYLSALHVFLKWCLERSYRTKPLPAFAWKDEDEGRIRWVTQEEEETLYSHLRGEATAMVVKNAILTGMRRSELISLEKPQVTRGWVHLWKTKTNTPRSVPITDESYDTLHWLIDNDRMPSASKLRYEWDMARKVMGLDSDPWFVFHACRHTCATRLVQANVNLRVVQTFMGHKRIETTLRYAHINDSMLTDALGTLVSHHACSAFPGGLRMNDASPTAPTRGGRGGSWSESSNAPAELAEA